MSEGVSRITPVQTAIQELTLMERQGPVTWWSDFKNYDNYFTRALGYLKFAEKCGLGSREIVLSCQDLAATLTSDPFFTDENKKKIAFWNEERGKKTAIERPPRTIDMNLDPEYFCGILLKQKSFEGRAFDPNSDKNYADIRRGDQLKFSLTSREFWHSDEARQLGLKVGMTMQAEVGDVIFSPLVHWMYEFNYCNGDDFQPMIHGGSELLYLQSAGVYYTFPGYEDKISEYGFVGIEVRNPKLL